MTSVVVGQSKEKRDRAKEKGNASTVASLCGSVTLAIDVSVVGRADVNRLTGDWHRRLTGWLSTG
jgi:hypothetical protein